MRLTVVKRPGDYTPSEGQEVIFRDGSRYLFAGYISRIDPTEVGEGQMIAYRIEATDYTYILINKNTQITYENETLGDIVADLMTRYVDSGYGFTTSNVATGPTISTISFNHISMRKAFEKLAKATGYEWYIDFQKDVHFFSKKSKLAPESFTDDSGNFESVDMTIDTSQVRNSVIVRGGRQESSAYLEEEFKGDGTARSWILREKPKTMVSIELDTGAGYVAKTYAVDAIDEDTGNDFMFNYQEKFVRATSTTTTPTTASKVRVRYYYEFPVLVKVTSANSITAMAALEGGDGKHEYVVSRPDVKSKDEARQIALKEIAEWGNPLLTARVRTRTGLLQSDSYFAPGQVATVNLPSWGITADTDYLIQEMETTLLEDGTDIEYQYEVTFGGRLIGIREFLEGVAGDEKVILDTEEIDRIEGFEEVITISEIITRDSNAHDVDETITASESVSMSKATPPYNWAPGGSLPMVWNDFEWN